MYGIRINVFCRYVFVCVDNTFFCVSMYQGIFTNTVTVMIHMASSEAHAWIRGLSQQAWGVPGRAVNISRFPWDGWPAPGWWSMAFAFDEKKSRLLCLKNVHESYQLEPVCDPDLEIALIKEFETSNTLAPWVSGMPCCCWGWCTCCFQTTWSLPFVLIIWCFPTCFPIIPPFSLLESRVLHSWSKTLPWISKFWWWVKLPIWNPHSLGMFGKSHATIQPATLEASPSARGPKAAGKSHGSPTVQVLDGVPNSWMVSWKHLEVDGVVFLLGKSKHCWGMPTMPCLMDGIPKPDWDGIPRHHHDYWQQNQCVYTFLQQK